MKKIACLLLSLCMLPLCTACNPKSSPEIAPHLIALDQAEKSPVRAADSFEVTQGFTQGAALDAQFDELIAMLYDRKKPDFTYALDRVENTYNAAVHILNRYIRNDFSTVERVHAIHDYLASFVNYDFALLEREQEGATEDDRHPSFTPEGALVHQKAVCDGISKAFSLLCGIEGIRCIRVTGTYSDGESEINHAWNKVSLSDDAADNSRWYNVDATMDCWHVMIDDKSRNDLLCHGYFLVSDEAITDPLCGRHTFGDEDERNFVCTSDYPFHANEMLGIGEYRMEITSQSDLNGVFAAVKNAKRKIGKIELKLNFDDYPKSNLLLPQAYSAQIAAAYKNVKDADFVINEKKGVYPYMRFPDGVFLFLIYK